MPDDKTPCQRVRDLYQNAIQFWRHRRTAMDRLEEFLAGDRYEDDHGAYNKDRRLVQIRGQETQDTIRHIAAKATERPRSIEPRPIDRVEDPAMGEIAAALLESDLSNPWKGFEDIYEAAILSCREKRLGVTMFDWVPDCGPYGEILDRYVDPRAVMWDPSYEDPHHPLCEWLLEERRIDAEKVNQTYGVDWVKPDKEAFRPQSERTGQPVMKAGGDRLMGPRSRYQDNKATVWFCWYKNDPKYQGERNLEQDLAAGDRYMACKDGCGYRSQSQDQMLQAGDITGPFPETLDQGCPTCAGNLTRVDVKVQDESSASYDKGKRLIILAPFSPGPNDDPLYDGKWPIAKARSFPGLFLTAHQKPGEPTGPCDVDFMWDQQVAMDQLRTMAIQRVFEHRNYWEMPESGIHDINGNRFEFGDWQFNVMFRDGTNQFQTPVTLHQGTGLDPSWQIAANSIQDALTRYAPKLDVGVAEQNTRNIPVGTVERITHEAEVSTEHFNRRKNRALSKFYGVRWDYIRATYTPARLARLNIDGVDIFTNLQGDDMPNFDFVLSDAPAFTGVEKARTEAFQGLLQVALNPQTQPFLPIFAEINNLPPSITRKVEKILQEMQAKADLQAQQAGMAGMPEPGMVGAPQGAGIPAGPPALDEMMNGGGMGLPPGA